MKKPLPLFLFLLAAGVLLAAGPAKPSGKSYA